MHIYYTKSHVGRVANNESHLLSLPLSIKSGSDAVDTAEREIGIWFGESELTTWTPTAAVWIYE